MNYFVDGDFVRFSGENTSGFFHKEYVCDQQIQYLVWLAEGNTPEPWQPEGEN